MNSLASSSFRVRWVLALFLLPGMIPLSAQTASAVSPPSAATTPADADWQELQNLLRLQIPPEVKAKGYGEMYRWMDAKFLQFSETATKFMQDYRDDPRRWELVRQMFARLPRSYVGFKPGFDEDPYPRNAVIDHAARARWLAVAEGYKAEMDADPNVPVELKEQAESTALYTVLSSAINTGAPVDVASLRRRLDAAEQRFPASKRISGLEKVYFMVLEAERPSEVEAYLASLAKHSEAELRQFAEGKQLLLRAQATGFDLAFTSLDGRPVDLAKLRGKVVLIDFWATWCGPCIAELPNIKKVYAAYHDKGFEIVGISLDKQEERQKLVDFVAQNDMPWPQHFDGKYWKNEIAVKYGINGIPAMFLIDPEGRLVSTAARGPKLEAEVKRLLNL